MAEQPPPYGVPPQSDCAPPQQGYVPPPQGYAPPPQGYAPPPQGNAPPPQSTNTNTTSNTTVVVSAPAQTVVVQKERFADKIGLNILISCLFWPWPIIWIILCIFEKEK